MALNLNSIKITIVGDCAVGKSCLLFTFTQKKFPSEFFRDNFKNLTCDVTFRGRKYQLRFNDTAGQENFKRVRLASYQNTDCFIVCYSIATRKSFENILNYWYPEINSFSPNVPIILVGTKGDLRIRNSQYFISKNEGKEMKEKINAYSFIECSALKTKNIRKIFQEAVRSVKVESHSQTCILQ